jgi:GNAT superfamily N-acetyltransferase
MTPFVSRNPWLTEWNWLLPALRSKYPGWNLRTAQILSAVQNSATFGLYLPDDPPKQIGFARVVSDRAIFSSLTEIYVDPAHRSKGNGTLLMNAVMSSHEMQGTIATLYTKDAERFYAHFGFRPVGGGVMIRGTL